ncbi:MAG: sensor histidine kinase [Steroidobacter sp.]
MPRSLSGPTSSGPIAHRGLREVLKIGLVLLFGALCGCSEGTAGATHFTQADYRVQSPSIVEQGEPAAQYEAPADAAWTTVTLPHVIPRPLVGPRAEQSDSQPEWATHWYRFKWRPQREGVRSLALYIPRRHLANGRFDLYVDGVYVDAGVDGVWNQPEFILLPAASAVENANAAREILIALSIEPARGGALSTVWIGPARDLQRRAEWRQFLQRGVPQVTSVAFLVFGAFALAFWLRRRRESAYLLFGLMAPVYCLRTLHYYVLDLDLGMPMLSELFWWMTINSLAWLQLLVYQFGVTLHGLTYPRMERVMIGAILVASSASLLFALLQLNISGLSPLLYLVQMGASIMAIALTTLSAIRSRAPMALLLAAMLCLFLVMGAHDWLLQNWRIDIESVYLLPYGSILVLGVALYAIFQRYIVAVNEADRFSASLEQRLAERSRELEDSHRKLRLIEHEQAVTGERQRLMREMHDGLGSSLMSSLVMVEQGKLDTAGVAALLRESIDDLKLTIDSLEPMGDDLLTLLGTLRYRLGTRLEAAGIRFEWHVQETPPLSWLNPAASLQILRVLQEALANILKHASADVIRVETGADDTHVFIRLLDNGRGFDVAAKNDKPTGRGLQNLQRRAAALNGRIDIASRPGETIVMLFLPLANAQ